MTAHNAPKGIVRKYMRKQINEVKKFKRNKARKQWDK